MPFVNRTVVHHCDDLLVLAEPAASGRTAPLVVSFSANVAAGVDDAPCFSARTLRDVDVHQAHVMACRRHGWQTLAMDAALAAVRAYAATIGAPRIVTLGGSVGGFAALLFAPALAAEGALALAPQFTVDLRKLDFDPRRNWPLFGDDALRLQSTQGIDGRLPHDDMQASLAAPVVRHILFDSRSPDALHARRMRGPGTTLHPLAHAGHAVSRFLRETGCLGPLLAAFADGDEPALRRCLARAWRRRPLSASYRHNLLTDRVFAHRHPARLLRALQDMAARQPDLLSIRRALVAQYLIVGAHDQALEAARVASRDLADAPSPDSLYEQAVRLAAEGAG